MEKFKTIILELDKPPEEDYNPLLDDDGSLWVIHQNRYINNELDFQEENIINYFKNKNLFLKTILLLITSEHDAEYLNSRYKTIFLFSKNEKFIVNKDPIREKHIWAHLDWGKRKHKFNPLGKDPSNVWIKVLDDNNGGTIGHQTLSLEECYQRIILCSSEENDNILLSNPNIKLDINRNIHIIKLKFTPSNSVYNLKLNPLPKKLSVSTNIHTECKVYYHSSEIMDEVKDNSIHTIVTSPPYWDLKNYNSVEQIGYKETYEQYHQRLRNVWRESYRILKQNGSIFINVNTYTKNKNMILIHHDIIKNMKEIGFKLNDIIMWTKATGVPNKQFFSDRFEYIMWFSKGEPTVYETRVGQEYLLNNISHNGNAWLMHLKRGNNLKKQIEHPAIYPIELAEKCISLTSDTYDTVLDPFLGSGTTIAGATNRNVYGYEINNNFSPIISERISEKNIKK